MQFSTLPESSHPFVNLRLIAPDDIPHWYEYLSMPVVFEHTSWDLQSPEELAHYADTTESRAPSSQLRLAIARRSDNRLVGTIGFHSVRPGDRSAEIIYDLSPDVWGIGIASHLCDALVAWAHDHVGLVRVQATVLASNARSAKVLQRCRFTREGLLHSYRMVRGVPGDFWMYAHLRNVPGSPRTVH
jgi:RimJ/RimL family protein N-acetyltransferase